MSELQKKLQELSDNYQKLQGGVLVLENRCDYALIRDRPLHQRRGAPEARVAAARKYDCQKGSRRHALAGEIGVDLGD
jgi:hypothetical protein